MPRPLPALLLAAAVAAPAAAADPDGFTPLFNGTDLSGWVNVNCAPGTFVAKNGEVVTTGRPTGFLRTARQYENFVLEADWMHENKTAAGNSGLFVWGDPLPAVGVGYTRGIEVQVLVNYETDWATSHGDLFSIWGAKCVPDRPHPKGYERCLPSERRCKGGGEWNHYKVTGNDGVIKLEVNGKEVSGVSKCNPRKGYLALESEGAVCHFKNLRIKELPSTNPKPEEVAKVDEGHTSLFNGLDLAGWKADAAGWKASDGVLTAGPGPLVSDATFGGCELVFDWKLPAKAGKPAEVAVGGVTVSLSPDGTVKARTAADDPAVQFGGLTKPGAWNRLTVRLDPKAKELAVRLGDGVEGTAALPAAAAGPVRVTPAAGLQLRSLFVREIKGK